MLTGSGLAEKMSKIRNTSPVDLKSLWVSLSGRRVLAHEAHRQALRCGAWPVSQSYG